MARILDKLAGAVTGFFSGLISGCKMGSKYYNKKWESNASPLGAFAGSIFGFLWGGLKYAFKGAAYGFKHGSKKVDEYTHNIEQEYFARIKQNKELRNQITHLSSNHAITLLSNTEQKQFEEHLKKIKEPKLKDKLQEDYDFYQSYLGRVCPLTNKAVALHHDPLEIEVKDPKTQELISKTYNRKQFLRLVQKNINQDHITKDVDTEVPIFPENVTHVGFPQRILDFVKTVRSRLNAITALLSSDSNLLHEYGYEKIKNRSPGIAANTNPTKKTNSGMGTPQETTSEPNRPSVYNPVEKPLPVNDGVQDNTQPELEQPEPVQQVRSIRP